MTEPQSAAERWPVLNRSAGVSWRFLACVAALAVVIAGLVVLRVVVVPLLLALLLASVFAPVAERFRRMGLPDVLAAVATLVVALVVGAAIALLVVSQLAANLGDIARLAGDGFDKVYDWLQSGPADLSAQQASDVHSKVDDAGAALGKVLFNGVVTGVSMTIQIIATVSLAAVLLIYLLADAGGMWDWFVKQAAPQRRARLDELGGRLYGAVSAYMRGTAVVALIDAVLIGLGFWIIGVPLPGVIAILVFFGAFLPIVGAWVVGTVGVMMALADGGIGLAIAAAAIVLTVQQLEGTFAQPLIVGRAVNLHPIITLTSVTAGTTLFGIIGGIIAVPTVAVAVLVGSYIRSEASGTTTEH